MTCVIDLIDETGTAPTIDEARLQQVIELALANEDIEQSELTVLIVDSAGSAALHAEHFNDDSATDVMTFPDHSPNPESGAIHLGDIAICVDVARDAAAARGRADDAGTIDECILYIVHGLLHLLGFDDREDADRTEMWARQRELVAAIGITIEAEPT